MHVDETEFYAFHPLNYRNGSSIEPCLGFMSIISGPS